MANNLEDCPLPHLIKFQQPKMPFVWRNHYFEFFITKRFKITLYSWREDFFLNWSIVFFDFNPTYVIFHIRFIYTLKEWKSIYTPQL